MRRTKFLMGAIAAALLILFAAVPAMADPATEVRLYGPSVHGQVERTGGDVTMMVREDYQLTAETTPEEPDEPVAWSSSDPAVAKVSDTGLVTPVKDGKAEITATSGSASATCTVTVVFHSGAYDPAEQLGGKSRLAFYSDGKIDTGFTGVAPYSLAQTLCYFEKGVFTKKTELSKEKNVEGKTAWWNLVDGEVRRGPDVVKNKNGWWYVDGDGKVDFSYHGFAKNANGWWYLEKGKVSFKKNDVIKGTVNGTEAWWNVKKSKVTAGPTVEKNSKGWWYIDKSGKVDFSYNGFAKNKNGWWYCEKGRVRFKKNDVIKGVVNGTDAWWNVKKSKIKAGPSVEKNSKGWWYIDKSGKVDFSYNGFAKNKNGWWYCEKGRVTFKRNDVIKGKVNGKSGWWYVKKSKVITNYRGIGTNQNGTWYIRNGRVDFGFTGTAKVGNKSYKVTKGRVADARDYNIANLKAAKSANQIVIVSVDGSKKKLTLYSKGANGKWTTVLTTNAVIGSGGLGKTKEGDRKTPVGNFTLPLAFGIKADPGTAMPYTRVNSTHYWVGDPDSAKYNQLVSTKNFTNFKKSLSEHLADYAGVYNYALAIGYNEAGTPGKGSAVFLNCIEDEDTTTGGSVGVPEDAVKKIIQTVKPGARIIIDKAENIRTY